MLVSFVLLAAAAVAPNALAKGTITIEARDARTGQPIPSFTYLVNRDNTTQRPSLRPTASSSPVTGSGNQASAGQTLTDGRYLVTVQADGYKLGGKHVAIPAGSGPLVVELLPDPHPLSTLRVRVFNDNRPVNAAEDVPVETGLGGFHVVVKDTVGEVTVNHFSDPLCGGACFTDPTGDLVIQNLPFGKYEIKVSPPDGSDWVQTTTVEGTQGIDAWVEEGSTGYAEVEFPAASLVTMGFAKPMSFAVPGTGTIAGTIRTFRATGPGPTVARPWIALNNLGGNDEQVYLGHGNADGTFSIGGVPAGNYQLAIWDEPLDHLISFETVSVAAGATANLGDVAIPRWFGWISGSVFHDANGNAIHDAGETGLPGFDLDVRFRDGSIMYATFADSAGRYEFPEVKELGKFTVAEVGFGRLARTGASVHDPNNPNLIAATHDGALTLNSLMWGGLRSIIDWGKRPYAGTANGGISGIVRYATTRNELNARNAAAEDYEPGIPGVTMRLWNAAHTTLLNEVATDSWSHPTGCTFEGPDPLFLGAGCIESPGLGNEVREGVFDGGYAFETVWEPAFGAPGAVERPLAAGDYVVDAVVPPHYQIVKEEDVNTDRGVNLVPAIPPPPCAGAQHVVNDPRSPYHGQSMPLCDRRLVTLSDGQNAAADFFLFTANAVPIPGRIKGIMLDDLTAEADPRKQGFLEKRGIANTPIGIRDYTGRLLTTVSSDDNGHFEVLLPSTFTGNCPTPSGVCPAMYLVVGNDPGDPGRPNANYNPGYDTMTLVFDVWPGKTTLADVAMLPSGVAGARCQPPAGTPELHRVSQPYVTAAGDRSFEIVGTGFGTSPGIGKALLNRIALPVTAWTNTGITVSVPTTFPPGAHRLELIGSTGVRARTGLTFHVLGTGYNPTVVTVSSGQSIQAALGNGSANRLVVVQPGTYFENVILHRGARLQGVGPGATGGAGGTAIDGRFFADPQVAARWEAALAGLSLPAGTTVPRGAAVTLVGAAGLPSAPLVDGLTITGGGRVNPGAGGIAVDANVRNARISNNVITGNSGAFGGAIAVGEPYAGDNGNDGLKIRDNRIFANGGARLAGAVAIFNGADNYEFARNHVCGNTSGEYGGALSHFGRSPGGTIHHNQFVFNDSFDEGGGILVGSELPLAGQGLGTGSGAVTISENLVQGNLSNDDGGGIRLLRALTDRVEIVNNIVVNNVATDLGGGIAVDDSSNVVIANNTVAKNTTTGTAVDSDGFAHSAGLVTYAHSAAFRASLPAGAAAFSDPVLFNNIFWDNRAYTWNGATLVPAGTIDLEVAGSAGQLSPRYSLLSVAYPAGATADPTNVVGADPRFVSPRTNVVSAVALQQEPQFVTVTVSRDFSPALGNYRVGAGSPALDRGAATHAGVSAPAIDIDDQARPRGAGYEIGADER